MVDVIAWLPWIVLGLPAALACVAFVSYCCGWLRSEEHAAAARLLRPTQANVLTIGERDTVILHCSHPMTSEQRLALVKAWQQHWRGVQAIVLDQGMAVTVVQRSPTQDGVSTEGG